VAAPRGGTTRRALDRNAKMAQDRNKNFVVSYTNHNHGIVGEHAGSTCRDSVGRGGLDGRYIRDVKISWFKNVNLVLADSMLISEVSCDEFRSWDSSVGMATRYGLDGPGIESRWERDFPHLSRLALRPTQPPVQWVPGLSRR